MINTFSPWMRAPLCQDHAIRWAKAKVYVYADSVLCLGKMHSQSEANEKWKSQIRQVTNQTSTQSCLESMENRLSSTGICSLDSHRLRCPERFRKIWGLDEQVQSHLKDEFFSSRCSTTLIGHRMEDSLHCISNSKDVTD